MDLSPETFRVLVNLGFAGLCVWFVLQSGRREDRMAKRLDEVEDRSVEVIENNTRAMTELTLTFNSRPCLLKKERAADGSNNR